MRVQAPAEVSSGEEAEEVPAPSGTSEARPAKRSRTSAKSPGKSPASKLHPRDDHPKVKPKGKKRRSRSADTDEPAAKKVKRSQHLSKRTLNAVKEAQKSAPAKAKTVAPAKAGRAAQLEMAAKRRGKRT